MGVLADEALLTGLEILSLHLILVNVRVDAHLQVFSLAEDFSLSDERFFDLTFHSKRVRPIRNERLNLANLGNVELILALNAVLHVLYEGVNVLLLC